eukprot:CAMPEP_0181250332 /NCGR_PEP_ID=MMETSP1096-20121128/46261_1 /TAXON_ID=156174 ORGANISM="Chrysochromulina ericina, Strain CCMP281" /NCGR_SAMPLE_ID=MMETSP1096 /ASSEMBLY_ACC=CAM_ASM_000453 /LENGTH=80 /DNA_ID=CAMNT_0023347789 /DNA_START=270 /DNA_END=512 /DNA_ORIENTATION=+
MRNVRVILNSGTPTEFCSRFNTPGDVMENISTQQSASLPSGSACPTPQPRPGSAPANRASETMVEDAAEEPVLTMEPIPK